MKITDYTLPLKTVKQDGTKVEIKEVHPGSGSYVVYRDIKRGRPSWKQGGFEEFVWPSGLGE